MASLSRLPSKTSTDGRLDLLVDAIKAVTDDWVNGGRLDLILDQAKADAGTVAAVFTAALIARLGIVSTVQTTGDQIAGA